MAVKKATRKVVPKGATKRVAKTTSKPVAKRRDPVTQVRAVDALPETWTRASDRSTRYARAMAEVRKKIGKGKWASIATFDGANGAAAVKRSILRGERRVDGRLQDWEVESRRVRNDAGDIIGSELFVRLK